MASQGAAGDAAVYEALRSRGRRLEVPIGEVLFHEGEAGSSLYLLEKGWLRLTCRGGDAEVTLAEVGPGAVLGEMAILDPGPRSATATALETVVCYRLSAADLDELLWEDPDTMRDLLAHLGRLVAERLRRTDEGVAALAAEARQRNLSAGKGARAAWRLLWTG